MFVMLCSCACMYAAFACVSTVKLCMMCFECLYCVVHARAGVSVGVTFKKV